MKTKLFLISTAFLLISITANAGDDNYPVGARSAGMSHSTVMLSDIWSIYHNQAGMAWVENISFGVHFENMYFVEETSLKSAAFALPVKSGVFGLHFSYFGYSRYNEAKVGLSFAKSIADIVAVGIQLDYFNTNIGSEYGNQGAAVAEIGIQARPTENLYIGTHLFNVTRAKIPNYDEEPLPTIFRFGLGYNFFDKLLLTTEIEKDTSFKPIYKVGGEYRLLDNLYLRGGISTAHSRYSFGLGFMFKKIHADLAFSEHDFLGFTTHISMHISL